MAKAMEYGNGLKNSRFDIVLLNRNNLDSLSDNKGKYYGQFKDILKQVFP